MSVDRRRLLGGFGSMAAASLRAANGPDRDDQAGVAGFPRKQEFAIPAGHTYINGAYIHPMPVATAENVRRYTLSRSQPDGATSERIDIKAEFAALINAKPSEIAFVPNTSTGENLVVNGLGLPASGGNVVTDALHFEGALIHLKSLQAQGLDLRVVKPRDWRIELRDLERVIDRKTRLVEVSHVAMYTGFQHDLKAVCDLAHANGALVYADVAQSAGCTPLDVRATGVDFCACSSFKWLMGDFGLGFLYVREELLGRILRRSQYGYYQAARMATHLLPFDSPGDDPLTFELSGSATGYFEVGSQANAPLAALTKSLPYIRKLGVANIEAYRQPMIRRLQQEMPRQGFEPITPPGSKSALVSFAVKDTAPYAERLKNASVNVRVGRNFIRLSPSVYNDLSDIDRFLDAVKQA
ncbi:MAG TPA: aminotransferase class V-fold PLP-dependent enzyme [Bryobacteraceae bacterium]|nr:aminotransferase class V-fold PLP-dependent enzyme [Bryobacteraceae bacterium]